MLLAASEIRMNFVLCQVKKAVKAVETAERLDHAKGLSSLGEVHHLVEDDAATLWSETVQQLPPDCLTFALNAAQDTLPHNANLAVWRRKVCQASANFVEAGRPSHMSSITVKLH